MTWLKANRGCWNKRFVASAVVFFFACVVTFSAAQGQNAEGENSEADSKLPRVSVGEINGNPGSNLMVPLYFTPDPNRPLRSISIELDYVSNSLKFQSAATGTAVEQSGATVKATLTDGTPDDKNIARSKLRIDIQIPEDQAGKSIPDGLLSFLMFRVSDTAKPFAIRLNTNVLAAQTAQTPSQAVADVGTLSGMIVVEQDDLMPEQTCFFFSH